MIKEIAHKHPYSSSDLFSYFILGLITFLVFLGLAILLGLQGDDLIIVAVLFGGVPAFFAFWLMISPLFLKSNDSKAPSIIISSKGNIINVYTTSGEHVSFNKKDLIGIDGSNRRYVLVGKVPVSHESRNNFGNVKFLIKNGNKKKEIKSYQVENVAIVVGKLANIIQKNNDIN